RGQKAAEDQPDDPRSRHGWVLPEQGFLMKSNCTPPGRGCKDAARTGSATGQGPGLLVPLGAGCERGPGLWTRLRMPYTARPSVEPMASPAVGPIPPILRESIGPGVWESGSSTGGRAFMINGSSGVPGRPRNQ